MKIWLSKSYGTEQKQLLAIHAYHKRKKQAKHQINNQTLLLNELEKGEQTTQLARGQIIKIRAKINKRLK